MTLKVQSKKIYQVILFVGLLAITVSWLSIAQQVSGQSQNLLLNGDFEEGYNNQSDVSTVSVAVGWTAFWRINDLDVPNNPTGEQPEFMASDDPNSPFDRANTGERSMLWHTKFSSAFAGVYQRVPVEPDSTLRLSAWSYAWSSIGNDPELSEQEAWVRQRIGIDPTGGTDPLSEDIVWSQGFSQHVDAWGQLSVEATATDEYVTVFLSAYPRKANPNNDIYYDSAELILISAALPTPRPIVSSGGVPGLAPTIDPLLLGLITGQGSAPGQQGIDIGTASTGPVLPGQSGRSTLPIMMLSVSMMLMLLIAVIYIAFNRVALATKPIGTGVDSDSHSAAGDPGA